MPHQTLLDFVRLHGNESNNSTIEQEIRDILVSIGQTNKFNINIWKVSQTVRIIDGAFADYTGKITESDNSKVEDDYFNVW